MDHLFDGFFRLHSDKIWLFQEDTAWCSLVGVHKLIAKRPEDEPNLLLGVTNPGGTIEGPIK